MNTNFIDLRFKGKNQWWHYIVGFFSILFFWIIIGSLAFAAFLFLTSYFTGENHLIYFDEHNHDIVGVPPLINFIASNIPHLAMLLGLIFVVNFIHKRSLKTLITSKPKIRTKHIFFGFLIYLLLITCANFIEFLINPQIFRWSFDWNQFFLFAIFALFLIPLQTTTEELFFRGYLVQLLGKFTKSSLVIATISGFLFMIPHLHNPEMANGSWIMAANYYVVGFFFTIITLKAQGAELAIGAHAANNLYACLIVNYDSSVLTTNSIFLMSELNPYYSLFSFIICTVIFYGCFFYTRRLVQ